jgi:hypothetical protein
VAAGTWPSDRRAMAAGAWNSGGDAEGWFGARSHHRVWPIASCSVVQVCMFSLYVQPCKYVRSPCMYVCPVCTFSPACMYVQPCRYVRSSCKYVHPASIYVQIMIAPSGLWASVQVFCILVYLYLYVFQRTIQAVPVAACWA